MERIAIIGAGIAGMGCAHYLDGLFDFELFEAEPSPGGHANTALVAEGDRRAPVDTGFMVYNETTYPLLSALFRELGVKTADAPMSFSVQHRPSGLEYCGSSLNALFCQRANALNPRFLRMLGEILRFNRRAKALSAAGEPAEATLGAFLEEGRFSRYFAERYLLPMTAAIWSAPSARMLDYPALSMARFLDNHGMLNASRQLQWKTVVGGSRRYRDRLIAPFRSRLRLACPIARVREGAEGVTLFDAEGRPRRFDQAVVATHADQALAMLEAPSALQRACLGAFPYSRNETLLHTDESVMPTSRRAWAAWNYRSEDDGRSSTHYWMNALQNMSTSKNYFVSLNAADAIDSAKTLWTKTYEHPLFTLAGLRAQRRLPRLNQGSRIRFCGSYFRYGFHEDALLSAHDLCQQLIRERSVA